MIPALVWSAVGFLSGSVMYSYLLPKWFYRKDITRISRDGNPGCGNVFTCIGIPCGVLCLLLELAKGALPVMLALRQMTPREPLFAAVAAAPVLGHAFSPMLRGKGGKAIAVTFGVFIGLLPHMLLLFWLALPLVVFSTLIRITPHSLRVMVSYLCMLGLTLLLERERTAFPAALVISAAVIRRHLGGYWRDEKESSDIRFLAWSLTWHGDSSVPAGSSHKKT